jgi:hypothetical protein
LLAAVEKTIKEGFGEKDLERAKGRLIRKILARLDTPYERV